MAIHLREPAADLAVRKLAARLGVSLTEAIRIAAVNELRRADAKTGSRRPRIARIQDRLKTFGRTGLKADKAFFDALSGDL